MRDLALRRLGRHDEAREVSRRALAAIDRRLSIDPGEARAWYLGAGMLLNLGEPERAFEYAEQAIAVDPEEVSTLYNVGCMYAQTGNYDRAIENLAAAIERGFASPEWIDSDPDWDKIRDDPRFQEIRRRMDKRD